MNGMVSAAIRRSGLIAATLCNTMCVYIEQEDDLLSGTSWRSDETPLGPLGISTLILEFNDKGEVVCCKIPYYCVVEMICDWIGAGMVYGGEKWTQDEPINYYHKVRAGRHFHRETESLIMKFLLCIQQMGLDEFHKMARCEGDYAYLAVDYNGLNVP